MKRIFTLAMILFGLIIMTHAQNVPNGGFEEWEPNSSEQLEPVSWQTNNMTDRIFVYQDWGHSGDYSAKINVVWDENLNMNITPVLYSHGFFEVSERFTSLKFYLTGESLNDDYLNVSIGMYKDGINIGSTLYPIYDDFYDWTQLTVPISYSSNDIPDHFSIGFTFWPASSVDVGSYFLIDDLELSMGGGSIPPVLLTAITNVSGTAFELNFNTSMSDPSGTHDQFSGTHNGASVGFTGASLKPGNNSIIVLSLSNAVGANEVLKVSYNAGTVNSASGVPLESFSNANVTNLVGGVQGAWQLVPSGVEENLYSVHFASSNVGFISGGMGRCLKSVNTGFNWAPLSIPSYAELFTIWATSDNNILIGAWDTIYKSTNGGQSWSGVNINTVNYYVMDLQFHSTSLGFAFLQASAFKKTTDGGNSWSEMAGSGVIDDFLAGYMIDETNGWAVGGAGLMAYTNDGGQTWPQYDWNYWTEWSPITIEGVQFTSMMNGFAVADSGVLFRTTNGGEHWTKQYLAGPDDHLMDIFFLNANLGWIVGYHGIIFSTTDGGDTWNLEQAVTANDLNSVHFIASNLGWAVGNNGTILRFGEGSSSIFDHTSSLEVPFEINPNPASSRVAISMTLPETMHVEFNLYDLSGKYISGLFQGILEKGIHVLPIVIPALPDGAYFCRMSCSSGTSARTLLICH